MIPVQLSEKVNVIFLPDVVPSPWPNGLKISHVTAAVFYDTKERFFYITEGENFELRADLNSEYRDKRKETVKKVIANMTVGKDVSGLFPDVVKNMQTEDLELKKLVYLYLINYAKTQPELVILAVNTFVKDSADENPLIRALAIRTMGCLRVEKIVDYLMDPLKKALEDKDPYVRKTAVLCVPKLFDLNPQIAIDNGLIVNLQDMLSDRNPMVITNSVSALIEINEASVQKDIFVINELVLAKLLAAMNECTEWGQIAILNCLSSYKPSNAQEASEIVERVIPRLQHVNSSVSLEAVKVLMIILEYNYSGDLNSNIVKKLAPPLITLLSSEPEIQYVALRNINLILQKRPDILSQEVRLFFTKYNDPAYVKLEKLEVIIKLANESNIAQVVSELKEYANEVDVEFVRRSVRAIGRCAIKIPAAADLCVETLLDLIKTGVAYIIQESIVITRDIFRKYPNRYEGIIQTLCDHLESIDEPEAKAALIWVIAEYAERIEGAVSLLEYFLQDFKDQVPRVQLQLLTSAVKIFLKKPAQCQEIVQKLLTETSNTMENPDIRDRAIVYWRLLSTNPESAKRVVLAEKPPIEFTTSAVSESLMNELLFHLGSLASVFHKSPSLVGTSAYVDMAAFKEGVDYEDDLDRKVEFTRAAKALGGPIIENLLDLDTEILSPTVDYSPSNTKQVVDDLLSLDLGPSPNLEVFLTAAAAQGFELSGSFSKRQGLFLDLVFSNKSSNAMSEFAIQFNVNRFGIVPGAPLQVKAIDPGNTVNTSLPLAMSGQKAGNSNVIQIAVKNNVGVYYFQTELIESLAQSLID